MLLLTRLAMLPSPLQILLLCALYSSMLAAAYVLQYGFGYAPCEMCLWQRGPYWVVFSAGLFLLLVYRDNARSRTFLRAALLIMLLAFLTNTILGTFHFGVEQRWWEGFTGCASSGGSSGSLDDLKATIMDAPIVRCDEPALTILGLSLSGWNAVASLAMLLVSGYFLGLIDRRYAHARPSA